MFFSAIISTISTVGSFVASVATAVVNSIQTISPYISTIAQAIGVLSPQSDIQDLGEKALQSDKKIEDFDNIGDYIEHLATVQLDPEKMLKTTIEDKLITGTSIAVKGIEDKLGLTEGSVSKLLNVATVDEFKFFTPERIGKLLESGINFHHLEDYFKGRLGAENISNLKQSLIQAEKPIDEKSYLGELMSSIERFRN